MSTSSEAPSTNWWCSACDQTLTAGRVNAHLASKKHAEAEKKRGSASTSPETSPSSNAPAAPKTAALAKAIAEAKEEKSAAKPAAATTKSTAAKPAAATVKADISLPEDPANPGKYVCNICKVSLDATRAAQHTTTATHLKAERKFIDSAMKGLAI